MTLYVKKKTKKTVNAFFFDGATTKEDEVRGFLESWGVLGIKYEPYESNALNPQYTGNTVSFNGETWVEPVYFVWNKKKFSIETFFAQDFEKDHVQVTPLNEKFLNNTLTKVKQK